MTRRWAFHRPISIGHAKCIRWDCSVAGHITFECHLWPIAEIRSDDDHSWFSWNIWLSAVNFDNWHERRTRKWNSERKGLKLQIICNGWKKIKNWTRTKEIPLDLMLIVLHFSFLLTMTLHLHSLSTTCRPIWFYTIHVLLDTCGSDSHRITFNHTEWQCFEEIKLMPWWIPQFPCWYARSRGLPHERTVYGHKPRPSPRAHSLWTQAAAFPTSAQSMDTPYKIQLQDSTYVEIRHAVGLVSKHSKWSFELGRKWYDVWRFASLLHQTQRDWSKNMHMEHD